MPDCVDCGFPNSFSAELVVCRNCGTALPHEPKSNSAAHSDSALPKSERTTSTIAISVAFDPENGRRPKRLVRVWLIVAFAVVGMFLFAWMVASGLDSTVSQNLSGVGPLPTERQEWSIALDDGDIVTIAWDLGYIYDESAKARNAQDGPLVDALALVIADLEDVQEALDEALDAAFREGTDDWAHQFTLVERLCERVTRNVKTMVSLGE